MKVIHTIKPIYNKETKILILGSMPSIISRENNFYYANKSNRFWQIINKLFNVSLNTNEEKTNFLLKNKIGIYDVIKECTIKGASDSTITNIKTNDIETLINNSKIEHIFCTGKTAYNTYLKYFKNIKIPYTYLPSPSSANATYSLEKLISEYKIIKKILD